MRFVIGCYNCLSRIEIHDEFIISRDTDAYEMRFGIMGYQSELKQAIAKQVLSDSPEDQEFEKLDELAMLIDNDFYHRDDVKQLALSIMI